jgi:hypothetical protein
LTEKDQLAALVAEYQASGLFVDLDVSAERLEFGIEGVRTLDLVGWTSEARSGRPALIVEIANRTRSLGRSRKPPWRAERWTDEQTRLDRFQRIARAIRSAQAEPASPEMPLAFVIRFLDVTAEQTRARAVEKVKVRVGREIREELTRTRALLDYLDKVDIVELQALGYAREWARWLRLLARRFPARRRALPEADLRTIQKELFDRLVLPLSPDIYQDLHAELAAIVEGGDLDWSRLLKLETPLKGLLSWAEQTMLDDVPAKATDSFEQAEARIRRRERGEQQS